MTQWILEHPYLFFTMFLFSLVTLVSISSEISNSIILTFTRNKTGKEKSPEEDS